MILNDIICHQKRPVPASPPRNRRVVIPKATAKVVIVYMLLGAAFIFLFVNPSPGDALYYHKFAALKLAFAISGYLLVRCLRRGW